MNNKILVKKNKAPDFKVCEMNCDNILSKKMLKFPMCDHLNKSNTLAIIGVQGSGKTSLMVNLLQSVYKKCFVQILVCMQPTSRKSIKNDIFKHLDQEDIYDELNLENMLSIYSKIEANAEKELNTLVIYDDVQDALKDIPIMSIMNKTIANQRHLHVCSIILLQNFYALMKKSRELINNVILFKMAKSQTNKIFDELVELNRDKYEQVMDLCYQKHGDWIFINVNERRMYKKFDEIIFNDGDMKK